MWRVRSLVTAVLCLCAMPVFADEPGKDDKSREDAMFGDDTPPPAKDAPKTAAPAKADSVNDAAASDLGDERMTGAAVENKELLEKDRTQIGGFFYTRAGAGFNEGTKISDLSLSNSTLMDTYIDSRPNDRLRAFVRGRISYNPLADVPSTTSGLAGPMMSAFGTSTCTGEVCPSLVEAWTKFDIARRVFVTLGKQPVRWGATRIWNPVDVVNTQRRNPLALFDERAGVPMLKLHAPFDNFLRSNLYAIVLVDNAVTLDKLGFAGRYEFLVGPAEIGLSGLARPGSDPKLGIDASSQVLDLDVAAECGIVLAHGDPRWQAAADISYTWAYSEDDSLAIGLEYFHNDQGVPSADYVAKQDIAAINTAIASGSSSAATLPSFTFLYTGRDYAALLAVLTSPGNWNDTSFTLTGISNLTDKSTTGQLIMSTLVLTDLSVQAFAAVTNGDGELGGYVGALKARAGDVQLKPVADALAGLHRPVAQAGLALRLNY